MNQDQAVSQKRSKPPKRMEIFRAANARELSQEVMPIEGVDAGVEAVPRRRLEQPGRCCFVSLAARG
jgi:hypothetical protein